MFTTQHLSGALSAPEYNHLAQWVAEASACFRWKIEQVCLSTMASSCVSQLVIVSKSHMKLWEMALSEELMMHSAASTGLSLGQWEYLLYFCPFQRQQCDVKVLL